MICGNITCLAKVALVIMIVSFVLATIAIFTPYWSEQEDANGDTEYTGLVVKCDNSIGVCSNLGDILDKYKDSDYYTDQLLSLSLAMAGWLFGLVAVIVLIVYVCLTNKITGLVSIIFCFLSGVCITAAVIIYGVGFEGLVDSFGWSLRLDAAARLLALVQADQDPRVCITAAVIIYGVGFEGLVDSFGWSLRLDAAARLLALVQADQDPRVCITAAVIIYGVGFEGLVDSFGWSLGLDAAAGLLALVAGIIVVINSCMLP